MHFVVQYVCSTVRRVGARKLLARVQKDGGEECIDSLTGYTVLHTELACLLAVDYVHGSRVSRLQHVCVQTRPNQTRPGKRLATKDSVTYIVHYIVHYIVRYTVHSNSSLQRIRNQSMPVPNSASRPSKSGGKREEGREDATKKSTNLHRYHGIYALVGTYDRVSRLPTF